MSTYHNLDSIIVSTTEIDNKIPNETFYENLLVFLGKIFGFFGSYFYCLCCCCFYPYRTVEQGSKGVIKKFGKIKKIVNPGMYYVNIMSEKFDDVDIRLQTIDLSRQSVITMDNISVNIDAVVYYRITNVVKAKYSVNNIDHAVKELSCATLRDISGHETLQSILENRDKITIAIQNIVTEKTDQWGVHIESIKLKDIMMSKELQEAMSSAAKARRQAESKLVSAQADVESATLMRKAADILDSKSAMQIRWLEAMKFVATSNNTKIIFMPTEHKGTDLIPDNLVQQQYTAEINE